jgi:hypothetical protein
MKQFSASIISVSKGWLTNLRKQFSDQEPSALYIVRHRGERDCLGEGRPEVCQSSSNPGDGGGWEGSELSNITPLAQRSISTPSKCYGTGSGIRCLFEPWIRDPGWVKIRTRIRDEQPGSYFRGFRNNFLG